MSSRYDAFIIWGNGLADKDRILERLRQQKSLEIIRIDFRTISNLPAFVEEIYRDTGVPISHLKEKTRYLLETPPEIVVITAINHAPDEQMVGEGAFRHVQCANIQAIKQSIRDEFNPRINGHRSEEHVLHSTDTEEEADGILRLIDLGGLEAVRSVANPVLKTPYHLPKFANFVIKLVSTEQLRARIITGKPGNHKIKPTKLKDTPHAAFVAGNEDEYQSYLASYGGVLLTDDHSLASFRRLKKSLNYLGPKHQTDFILVKKAGKHYEIHDGLHRAVIVAGSGKKNLLVAVIEEPA